MGDFLDAEVGQMTSSGSSVQDVSAQFLGVIEQARDNANYAMAMNTGEMNTAFQASHARFADGATKLQGLLQLAGVNVNDGATGYQVTDASAGGDLSAVAVSDASGIFLRG